MRNGGAGDSRSHQVTVERQAEVYALAIPHGLNRTLGVCREDPTADFNAAATPLEALEACLITNVKALPEKMLLGVDGVRADVEGDPRTEPSGDARIRYRLVSDSRVRSTGSRNCTRWAWSGVRLPRRCATA